MDEDRAFPVARTRSEIALKSMKQRRDVLSGREPPGTTVMRSSYSFSVNTLGVFLVSDYADGLVYVMGVVRMLIGSRVLQRPRVWVGVNNPRGLQCSISSVSIAVLALDRPDAGLIFFERVDVHHPVEDYGMEGSTRGIAGFLGGDRSS